MDTKSFAMQRQYYTAIIMLEVPKPMAAALEIIEIAIDGVIGEIMKRKMKKTGESKDRSSDIENPYNKGFCQNSQNTLEKQKATLELRKRNLCLTNGSLKSGGDSIQCESRKLEEKNRIITGTSKFFYYIWPKMVEIKHSALYTKLDES